MKTKICFSCLLLGLVLFSANLSAQVPQMINYQGKLTNASGAPVNDTLQIVFTIYADEAGTTPLWTETQPTVEILKGVFNVLLGSVNPIDYSVFDGSTRYLGVQVGGDPEITPRKPMVSVAYAYRAGSGGSGSDNKWVFRITDTADTSITTGGNWGIARRGATLFGDMDSTHVNLGVACTTGTSSHGNKYCTVAGGILNSASESATTVGGGVFNVASGFISTVAGGDSNVSSNQFTTIGGGAFNLASGPASTVAGGRSNTANMDYSTVGGGISNTAGGYYMALYTTVAGGNTNKASNWGATVGGGEYNLVSGEGSTVPGGARDTVEGACSFATGCGVKVTGNNTFAFGSDFTTPASNAVVFYDAYTPVKVAIGSTFPTQTLDVTGSGAISGSLGVGTTSPNTKFEVRGDNQTIRHATSSDVGRFIQMGYNGSVGPLIEGDGYPRLTIDADVGAGGKIVLGRDWDYVGIGTIDPNAALDIDGDLALRVSSFTAVNGDNDNIATGGKSFIRITGPTGPYTITGINATSENGKIVILYNATGQNMTIANESLSSFSYNRILTMTGANESTAGTGNVTLIYDATGQRWIVTATKP